MRYTRRTQYGAHLQSRITNTGEKPIAVVDVTVKIRISLCFPMRPILWLLPQAIPYKKNLPCT